MYEIDVLRFTIKKEGVEQAFTIENFNFERELFMSNYMDFINEEVVTDISLVIYHNRDVKYLKIDLLEYSVKNDHY